MPTLTQRRALPRLRMIKESVNVTASAEVVRTQAKLSVLCLTVGWLHGML